jgi:DNA-binding response OmpR family regulator
MANAKAKPKANARAKVSGPLLVIEDDDLISKLVRVIFEHRGYAVEVAETYADGAAAIEASKPRVIILDIALPDGDGLDLLRHLRRDLHRTEPVVVLTASRREDKYLQAFQCGASGFVTKPFDPKEFGDLVEFALAS